MPQNKSKLMLYLLTIFLTIQSAQAGICEKDQKNAADWKDKCEKLGGASILTGTIGGAFAICTFGISMAPCIALSATAYDACCKAKEHERKLSDCQARERAIAQDLQDEADELAKIKTEVDALILKADKGPYAYCTNLVNTRCDREIEELVIQFEQEGYNLDHPEAREHIDCETARIEENRRMSLIGCSNSRAAWITQGRDKILMKYGRSTRDEL